jgi:hypothetical protein
MATSSQKEQTYSDQIKNAVSKLYATDNIRSAKSAHPQSLVELVTKTLNKNGIACVGVYKYLPHKIRQVIVSKELIYRITSEEIKTIFRILKEKAAIGYEPDAFFCYIPRDLMDEIDNFLSGHESYNSGNFKRATNFRGIFHDQERQKIGYIPS